MAGKTRLFRPEMPFFNVRLVAFEMVNIFRQKE
ncbi:hypothetical protein EDC39_1201, partial [Geothermobacter ehrlichii]